MPNYSLVISSKFKPFSYQELMAPVKAMSDYHEKLADEYDKLSTQADILEAMGQNDRDKESGTYARYKSYSDALRQEADNLYRFGLNTESRQRLSELRRRYNTDIVPIQNAWNKREEEAKMQAKAEMEAAARGIDLRFSRRAADTALQNYVDNPNQTFRAITGQQITTEVANQFQGLAKQIQQDRNGNYWIGQKQLSPIEYAILTQKGMDYNQFADFINNPNDPSYSTIRGIVDSTLAAHGIQDFDPQTQADMFRYGAMGVSAGVGERGMQFHTDPYASKILDAELSAELERRKQQLKETGEVAGDPYNIGEERAGITTKEGYRTDAPEIMGSLKVGHDGLKASVFGKYAGKVNPLAVYEEYQNASSENEKKEVLRKHGVTSVLSEDQYNLMRSMGYDNKTKFGTRYSDIQKKMNEMATQHTRYSTNMSGYEYADEKVREYLTRMDADGKYKSASVWKIDEDGKRGKVDDDISELNLYSSNNTKGSKVTNVLYDPRYKGMIVVRFNNGQQRIITPDAIDAKLTEYIRSEEAKGTNPRNITAGIIPFLNGYNKTKGKSEKEA